MVLYLRRFYRILQCKQTGAKCKIREIASHLFGIDDESRILNWAAFETKLFGGTELELILTL